MFVVKPEDEVLQVDFWNMYKEAFSPFAPQYPHLGALDVIKHVNKVFPQAQLMSAAGPVQRFVVRGIQKRSTSCLRKCHATWWQSRDAFLEPSALQWTQR